MTYHGPPSSQGNFPGQQSAAPPFPPAVSQPGSQVRESNPVTKDTATRLYFTERIRKRYLWIEPLQKKQKEMAKSY